MARIAGGQHTLITRPQLLAIGMTRGAIAHRLRIARMHLMFQGVYSVGTGVLTPLGHDLAAVLACGPGAVLSSLNAAVVWDLLGRRDGPVHVLTAGPHRRAPNGVIVHRTSDLPPTDTTTRHAIPITTPTRTLLDLAAHASRRDLERALAQAEVNRLVRPDELKARAAGRRGAKTLRDLLDEPPAFTRSEAERRLLALIARAGLPRPRTNVRVAGYEVDALWPGQRLVAEVDGYAFHAHRAAFERDRLRDADLQTAGLRVLRFTWRQLTTTPEAVAIRLATALA